MTTRIKEVGRRGHYERNVLSSLVCAGVLAVAHAGDASPGKLRAAAHVSTAADTPTKAVTKAPTPASIAPWKIDARGSSIVFSATQAGAKFEGHFARWSGDVRFNNRDLPHSHALVKVQVGSLSTASAERDTALNSADWFDPARWPQAVFETTAIRATGTGYEADGRLTLRDQVRPIKFVFTVRALGNRNLRLEGHAHLARLDFGLGQGEFKSTEWVGNDVEVRVVVVAQEQP